MRRSFTALQKGLRSLVKSPNGTPFRDPGAYFYELAIRSSTIRTRLKEELHEPAIETCLRQVRDFASIYQWKADEIECLKSKTDIEKIELFCATFVKWYFAMRAPSVVHMNEPWGWYPKARAMRRKVIFHAGPTNSGKTHAALERLTKAKSGVYCAPLKALAAQVWRRINDVTPCDLLIGDERVFPGFAEHVSCTMEMTPIDEMVEVGVIDEIQLIEDKDRGWAWTRALLGLPAREIHLCGEFRALNVVEHLLYATRDWDNLEIVQHNRLVPLRLEHDPVSPNLKDLSRGDCIVVFSRNGVFQMRQRIEAAHPEAVVNIIYGGLPFDVRQAQCDAYNAGVENGKFHVLVSTDAIAYGLNMNIRRIIFSTTQKYNGRTMAPLSTSQVLQIGGRAGRFGLSFADAGYVTSFHSRDNEVIRAAFASRLSPVTTAGLLPTVDILHIYATLRKELTRFSELLQAFVRESTTVKYFHVCDISRSLLPMSRILDDVPLPLADKILFCFVPLSDNSRESYQLVHAWAQAHCTPPHKVELGDALSAAIDSDLKRLEWRYRLLEAYCWLAWRFPKTFSDLEKGKELKKLLVEGMKRCVGAQRESGIPAPHCQQSVRQEEGSELREFASREISERVAKPGRSPPRL